MATTGWSRVPALNPAWVDALMFTADSPEGRHVVAEPEPPAHTADTGDLPELDV
ncbi:hypothetical protein JNB63_04310 [Microbacterium trichothecenolyticum]|uniref:hypothetical protein n=1 Tax=Microbacterium trichothecenolyticum TaxID=69370 RepID=UPI001C6E93F6|nr:hypothetical protein [Microbacterium trichothecenolyticum]MBW9119308.1 hypothetical protein [Microbacterium trichothecenolyticum]